MKKPRRTAAHRARSRKKPRTSGVLFEGENHTLAPAPDHIPGSDKSQREKEIDMLKQIEQGMPKEAQNYAGRFEDFYQYSIVKQHIENQIDQLLQGHLFSIDHEAKSVTVDNFGLLEVLAYRLLHDTPYRVYLKGDNHIGNIVSQGLQENPVERSLSIRSHFMPVAAMETLHIKLELGELEND